MSSWTTQRPIKKRIIPISQPPPNIIPVNNQTPLKLSKEDFYLENSSDRINTFHSNNSNAIITFIIPTIGRDSLIEAINSIINQNTTNWKAIIIFDGCVPTDNIILTALNDTRFLPICIDKAGQMGKIHNSAGKVRNIGMDIVNTEWIGFLDDDDKLVPTYTSKLVEETRLNPRADVIIFRMLEVGKMLLITPTLENSKLFAGNVGISFCLKTKLVNSGFKFEQSEVEDFTLINKLNNSNIKMIISPYITYLVNSTPFNSNYINTIGSRTIIN